MRSAAEVTLADVVAAAAVAVDGTELPDDPALPLPEPPDPLDPVDGSWPASASARVSLACASVAAALSTSAWSEVRSSVASLWPTVTFWPTRTETVFTVPADGNATAARATGEMVPAPFSDFCTEARRTVATR